MTSQEQIKVERVLLSFVVTFVLADIYPHPNLSPGLMQSSFNHIQTTILSE